MLALFDNVTLFKNMPCQPPLACVAVWIVESTKNAHVKLKLSNKVKWLLFHFTFHQGGGIMRI